MDRSMENGSRYGLGYCRLKQYQQNKINHNINNYVLIKGYDYGL